MPGGEKAENNLPLIAKTFKISTVDAFSSSLLLKYTNKHKVTCKLVLRDDSPSLKSNSSRKRVTANLAWERGDAQVQCPSM